MCQLPQGFVRTEVLAQAVLWKGDAPMSNTPALLCGVKFGSLLSSGAAAAAFCFAQFFLVLGVSYFLLLEYHSSRGIPMDGSVITPKAAQSSCRRERESERGETDQQLSHESLTAKPQAS